MLLAGSISHTSIHCIDFVEVLNISLDLSTIYFAYFSGCSASFCIVVTLSYNLLSGVKLSIRSFSFILLISIRLLNPANRINTSPDDAQDDTNLLPWSLDKIYTQESYTYSFGKDCT